MPQRFDFAFDPAYRSFGRVFGVRPATAWVEVGAELLEARFGPWHVSTPLSNVVDARLTGPYAFWKTAGPARLAVTDRGLTFATRSAEGVLICFATPIQGIDPFGWIMHPELTVTVRDGQGLIELLRH